MNESELQLGQVKSRWKAGLALFLFLFVISVGLTVQAMQSLHEASWTSIVAILFAAAFPWSTMILFFALRRRLPAWLPATSFLFTITGWFGSSLVLAQMLMLVASLPGPADLGGYLALPIADGFACTLFAFSGWVGFVPVLKSHRISALKSVIFGASVLGVLCGMIALAYARALHVIGHVDFGFSYLAILFVLPVLSITAVLVHYSNEAMRSTGPHHDNVSLVEGLSGANNDLQDY